MSRGSTRPNRPERSARHRLIASEGGFTLTELLVVLVIVAIIGGVLMSAFERVLDIRVRLAAFLDGVDAPTLVADWFRASVAGLMPDAPTGDNRFVGRPRQFSGLSVAAPNGAAGVPTRIAWEIVYEPGAGRSYLRYRRENDPEMTIASWPGDYGGIAYCDPDRVCGDTWPSSKQSEALPALIRLDAVKGTEPWPILAAPQAARNPPPAPQAAQ